jgi:mRNA interferase HigB
LLAPFPYWEPGYCAGVMRVISRKRLREFWVEHADAERPLKDWFALVRRAQWRSHHEVKAQFRNASVVRDCVVFNIGGNKFRLVAWINYTIGVVLIKSVMTHEEYDETTVDCRRRG